MNKILLRGRMIDAVSDTPVEDAAVLIEGDRIAYAGPYENCPEKELPAYSFPGGTILPGFIDVHAHLTGDEDAGSFANGQLFGDQLIGAVYQVGLLLDAGFTGIRDMSEWDAYVAELEKIANIDDLLSLYNNAKTIVRDPERIFVAK